VTQRQIHLAFFGVLAAMALAALDGTAVATALPQIVGELHGFDRVSWVVTAYLLASTVTIPLYGKLSDLYGRRNLFVVAIVVFVVGSVLCAASQTMIELVVARGIQGLGAGGLIPLAIATIGDLYSPRERGRIQGYTAGLFGFTSVAGPLLGGLLTDHATWRWIFLINIPVGALALGVVLVAMKIPRSSRQPRIDVMGSLAMIVASSSVLLALVWGGNQYPWGSVQVLGLLAVSGVLCLVFIAAERRAPEPIIPLGLFRNRVFAASIASGPVVGASMYVVTVYIPIYVQQVAGGSATGSGVVLIPYMLGWVVASMIVGRLITRTGRYKIFPIAGSTVATVGFVLLSQLGPDASRLHIVAVMVVTGIGMGPLFQTYTVAVQNAVPATEIGSSTAALQFIRSMGGALGLAAFAAMLTGRLGSELARRVPAGSVDARRLLEPRDAALRPDIAAGARAALAAALDHVYLWCVPLMAFTVICALLLPELPLRTVAPHTEVVKRPGD
jgi:EmrB/QacA subfamily drug resistance transporter